MSIDCSAVGNLPGYSSTQACPKDSGNTQVKIDKRRIGVWLPGVEGFGEAIGILLTGGLVVGGNGEETKVEFGDVAGVVSLRISWLAEKKPKKNKPTTMIAAIIMTPAIVQMAVFIGFYLIGIY
jgi:hypothetical protein